MTNLERLFREHLKFSSIVTNYVIWNLSDEIKDVSGSELYNWLLAEEEGAPPVAADGAWKDES